MVYMLYYIVYLTKGRAFSIRVLNIGGEGCAPAKCIKR